MTDDQYYQAHFTANIFDILKNRYFNVSEKVTSLEKPGKTPFFAVVSSEISSLTVGTRRPPVHQSKGSINTVLLIVLVWW